MLKWYRKGRNLEFSTTTKKTKNKKIHHFNKQVYGGVLENKNASTFRYSFLLCDCSFSISSNSFLSSSSSISLLSSCSCGRSSITGNSGIALPTIAESSST